MEHDSNTANYQVAYIRLFQGGQDPLNSAAHGEILTRSARREHPLVRAEKGTLT